LTPKNKYTKGFITLWSSFSPYFNDHPNFRFISINLNI